MKIKFKCKYCGALLSKTNSVFIHITRYDDNGRHTKKNWLCCNCWDGTQISAHYIEKALNKAVCNRYYSVKNCMKSDKHCFNCKHLLFKDYRHNDGTCGYTHRIKSFYDRCDYKEEMS